MQNEVWTFGSGAAHPSPPLILIELYVQRFTFSVGLALIATSPVFLS
jgi:hypothetical protein